MDCTPCAMGLEWLRSAYACEWRLFKDRPDILVSGRYYRVPDDHPTYPGYHHCDSRNWLQPDDDAIELGESYTAKQVWSAGEPRGPIPIPPKITPEFTVCLEAGEKIVPPNSAHQEIHEGRFPVHITGNGFPTRIQIPTRLFVPAIFVPGVVLSGSIDFTVTVDGIGVPAADVELAYETLVDVDGIGVPDCVIETPMELAFDVDGIGVPDCVIETASGLELDVDGIGVPDCVIEAVAELELDVDGIGVPDCVIETASEIVLDIDGIGVPDCTIETDDGLGPYPFSLSDMTDVFGDDPEAGEFSWGQEEFLTINVIDGLEDDFSPFFPDVTNDWPLAVYDPVHGHSWDYEIIDISDNEDGTYSFDLSLLSTNYPFGEDPTIGPLLRVIFSLPD